MVKQQFEADEAEHQGAPDPTPPHVSTGEKESVGKWALHKAIDEACQVPLFTYHLSLGGVCWQVGAAHSD